MSLLKTNAKDRPPFGNPKYSVGCCMPCGEDVCDDIKEGEYTFTGPKIVHLTCEEGREDTTIFELQHGIARLMAFPRVFGIFEDLGDGCYEPVASVSAGNPAQLCCAKNYVIRYKWDNCFDKEPVFIEADDCCN